jgi:hypothetical protein
MFYPNNVTRYNAPTIALIENQKYIRIVTKMLFMRSSKRAIAQRLGLNWRQANVLVDYVERKGVLDEEFDF